MVLCTLIIDDELAKRRELRRPFEAFACPGKQETRESFNAYVSRLMGRVDTFLKSAPQPYRSSVQLRVNNFVYDHFTYQSVADCIMYGERIELTYEYSAKTNDNFLLDVKVLEK